MSIEIKHKSRNAKYLIIFIHGLGGDIESFRNSNNEFFHEFFKPIILENCDIGYYQYTSKLITSKLISILSNYFQSFAKEFNKEISDISDILKTDYLNLQNKYDSINFICHSMGGLIIKDLLLNKKINFSKKIFYITLATPHHGSDIADKLIVINNKHSQIKVLKTDSKTLTQLNNEFKHQKDKFNRKYYYASHDTIVTKNSAFSEEDEEHLLGVNGNHISICKPKNDLESVTLTVNINDTIIDFLNLSQQIQYYKERINTNRQSLVLFDSLCKQSKPFYLYRDIDKDINDIQKVKSTWLFGESGIGKTCIAQNYFFNLEENCFFKSIYFTTTNDNTNEHLQLIYEYLVEEVDQKTLNISNDEPINIKISKLLCHLLQTYKKVIIHLDEISNLSDLQLEKFFISFIDILTNQRNNCVLQDIRLVVTTIFNPLDTIKKIDNCSYKEKIHSQFEFINLKRWTNHNLFELYNLISKNIDFYAIDIQENMDNFNGKPRVLKDYIKLQFARKENKR